MPALLDCFIPGCTRPRAPERGGKSELCEAHQLAWSEEREGLGEDPHPWSLVMRWERWLLDERHRLEVQHELSALEKR